MSAVPVSAAIIAGGGARRFGGRTKALLDVGGETILRRQLAALRPRFDDIIASANEPAPFSAEGLRVVADRVPGAGPLAGIAAALAACRHPLLFAVAGDMPFVHAPVIDLLLARARALAQSHPVDAAWATAAVVGGRPEPLFAIYSRGCAPVIARRLAVGLRAARALFESDVRLFPISESELRPLDPMLRFLTNVNEPSDLP